MAVVGVRKEQNRNLVWGAAAVLLLPLVGAWSYSLLSAPLYLPGRYDTIVLPMFIVLFAVGLDRVWRWRALAGAAVGLGLLVLAAATLPAALDRKAVPVSLDVSAGRTLARVAAPGDRVVATALRRQITGYYAARSGFHGTIETFPSEVSDHPGWESTSRMLENPSRLEQDGARMASELIEAARQGHRVWLLPTARGPINDFFFPLLFRELEPDPQLTFQDAALVGLRLR
jgi:hypothetical protein